MAHYISIDAASRTKKHYENFPVATLIFPKQERLAATVLYKFARDCDDIADEGDLNQQQRYEKLEHYQANIRLLNNTDANRPDLFVDLKHIAENYQLDISLFERLLQGFRQDIANNPYQNFAEVIHYCHLAACPAGEMILTLFRENKEHKIHYANQLCICLALLGMLQDIKEDFNKGRVYVPQADFKKFNLKPEDIENNDFNAEWDNFKANWITRIENYLAAGKNLQDITQGRLRLQMKVLVLGCELLIWRLKKRTNLFLAAPKLTKLDWLFIFFRAVFKS